MVPMKAKAVTALLAVLGLAAAAGPAAALDWVGVGMAHIPIRAYASAAAPVVGTIKGGSFLALTGQCTRHLDLEDIAYKSAFRQRLIVASRWCEVSGPAHGWVFGGFMKPW
jgi:hypothetical protein